MFKSQNIHNLYFCCNRCNSLTFMLDYDEDFKRFKSKLFTKLTTGRPWDRPWPAPSGAFLPLRKIRKCVPDFPALILIFCYWKGKVYIDEVTEGICLISITTFSSTVRLGLLSSLSQRNHK